MLLNEGIKRVIRYADHVYIYAYVNRDAQEAEYLKDFQKILEGVPAECVVDFDVRRSGSIKQGDYVFSLFPLHKWIHRN